MADFAKIFNTEKHGQVLVMFDSGDNGAEVKFFFKPFGFGVCQISNNFIDTKEGWDSAQRFFESIDEAKAVDQVLPALTHFSTFFGEKANA
tara:strand:+ start:257 stop:529 length:273 start_codon:yes stop_codon:yes gene_type:complete